MVRNLFAISYLVSFSAFAQVIKPLAITIDADFSNHFESSQAIERGLTFALKEVNHTINGRKIIVKRADHRGNTKRSKRNIKNFLKEDNGLLLMSGIHSPPLLAHKDFINKKNALFMVPWAAAGPITRSNSNENWIFRLSIDDSKAGRFIAHYVAKERKAKKPCLLLENTGWGKSNFRGMSNGFKELGISVQKTVWFKWGIKKQSSNEIAKELYATKCDAVLLVANSKEGASLVNAIARNKTSYTLPIISHWGITGGDFHKTVPYDIRESVELSFIQTKFNFITSKLDKSSNILLKKMISEYSDISSEKDIMAPSGFIHAYDLGRILITALKSVDVEKDIKTIRFNLKNELENLKSPVKGLLKKYTRPFEKYTKLKKDAHEALDIKDFAIGSYGPNGETINKSWDF